MGLFINGEDHPDVYKNDEKIHTSNQRVVRHHFLTELIAKQQEVNSALARSIAELTPRLEQLEAAQTIQWNQMNDLKAGSGQREKLESQMIEWLNTLDEKNMNLQAILENEILLKKSILDQMNHLNESNQDLTSRLEKNEAANQQLSLQLNEQLERQADKLSNQEELQAEVLKRLDTQEVLTEKISRQLNQVRSILFERTNYLAAKLEDGYQLTSSYVYKLMTGSDQPLTFSLMNRNKEKQQKHSD